ncbi:MAG: GAF domain-containing protein [Burkholderiaceae bacterium]|nr:GAF domain-containing protein [Burkholderiaceae bacterium]
MHRHSSHDWLNQQINPTRIMLAYAVFAALWIIASGAFLTFTIQDQYLQAWIEIGKGLLFVVVTSVLLNRVLTWHQTRIKRLTHLYAALSQCNQAIVHCVSEQELFPKICQAAVSHDGIRMAWIGMVDQASGQVRPAASCGQGEEYLREVRITTNLAEPWGRGPVGTAVNENRPVWCQDFKSEPMLTPWHEQGRQYGFGASAVLPLHRGGLPVGVFCLYAGRTHAFDSTAHHLLTEMAQDISFALDRFEQEEAHKRIEQQARGTQLLMQHFLDNMPGAVYIKDSGLRVLLANRGFQTLFGLDPAEMIGKTNREIFSDDLGAKISQDDMRVLASGKAETVFEEYQGRRFESTKFVIEDEAGGQLLGGITLDVTQRHLLMARQQALLELNELGAQFPEKDFLNHGLGIAQKLTVSGVSFLRFISDEPKTDELVTWSQNAGEICGLADYPITETGAWAECLREKRTVVINNSGEHLQTNGLPDSGTLPARLVLVPVIEEGSVRMILGAGHKEFDYDEADVITLQLIGNDLWRVARRNRVEAAMQQQLAELKGLNQQLEETHNQLVQSEKMAAIGQLSAGIAHEINNPISFIQSNFSSLSGYLDDLLAIDAAYSEIERKHGAQLPQAFEQVQQIKNSVGHDFIVGDLRQLIEESREGMERVRKIVQDLRNFSRVGETGWQWADLHQGINSTMNIVRSVIREEVELVCEFGELPLVRCLPAQLNQVFLNLLVNGAQAIAGAGRVMVRTGCEGDRVWVEIVDSGSGIAPENMKRLFEPFFTTKPVGQGTGLGLSLSWSIVQRHGGKIEVDSNSGQGTVFRVILPVDSQTVPEIN